MLLVTVATRTFPRFLLALAITIVAASPAAAQRQTSVATVRITATVPAMLSISSASIVSRDSSGGFETITTRVMVRGNVSHTLEARAASAQETEVRLGKGNWVRVPADQNLSVARTDMIGETSHLVICRTPLRPDPARADGSGCALSFAIASTDPQFPAQSASLLTR